MRAFQRGSVGNLSVGERPLLAGKRPRQADAPREQLPISADGRFTTLSGLSHAEAASSASARSGHSPSDCAKPGIDETKVSGHFTRQ